MATMVPFLRVSKLKDREIESIVSLVIRLLTETALPLEIYAKVLAELQALLETYQQAIHRERKSALTVPIREVDVLRNEQFNSFVQGVKYYLTLKGTTMGDAAEVLKVVLDKHRIGISRESDKVKTVKLRAMLADLAGEEEAAALEMLSFGGAIMSLGNSNEKFDKLTLQRAADDAEDNTPSLLTMRKLLSETMYLLVYLVNFGDRTESEAYGAFAGELAEIISDTMTIAKARETRNSHEEEESEGEEVVVEEE